MHLYQAFNLTLAADLKIIEFLPTTTPIGEIQAKIYQSSIPENTSSTSQQFLLDIRPIARFLIKDGNQIIYDNHLNLDLDSLRLFLLGSAIGALLQQRGYIVLHGNAVSVDGKSCTVFVGEQGSGKSTMAAWHYQQGSYILADDVCAITFIEDEPYVIPSYPHLKLWQNSADLLGISTETLRRVRPQDEKYSLPIHSQFYSKSLPLKEIKIINPKATTETLISGTAKLQQLIQHSYRFNFLSAMDLNNPYIKQLMKLANQVTLKETMRIKLNTLILADS